MVKRSGVADEIVRVIGLEAAGRFFNAYGGKQLTIPDGTGRPGCFVAALDELIGSLTVSQESTSVLSSATRTLSEAFDQLKAEQVTNCGDRV